jgi:threonine aldolase
MIDLRSDTVTQPTAAMWDAMRAASLGDDTLEGDATVQALEALGASLAGKEAALFVVSGTMGNLLASLCYATRGGEAVLDAQAHMAKSEAGGVARIAHLYPVSVPSRYGEMDLNVLADVLRPGFSRYGQPTAMVCVETTHNHSGGYVPSLAYMEAVRGLASRAGIAVHVDGARAFNAAVSLGVELAQLAAHCDSITFCLSKGLSAPMGSILAGSHEFIVQARTFRRMVGGGLRQAGIMAAAGKVALESMVERLADDHRRAQGLWQGLADLDATLVDPAPSRSNIVRLRVDTQRTADARAWERALEQHGVLARASGAGALRLVTHRHIEDAHIEHVIDAIARIRTE